MKHAKLILILTFCYAGFAEAQIFDRLSNPQVTIRLTHPPGYGMKVNKVAFGPATGTCSDQLVDGIIGDFVSNSIEVIDRENLKAILSEQSFTLSGSVDKTTAATLGKILGPTVLLFVNVQRCTVQQDKLYDKETKYDAQRKVNYYVWAYHSRTRAFLKVSVRTVDLSTGRIFAAQTLEYSPEKTNKSYEGYPEFPSSYDLQDLALKYAVWDIHKMYLPWQENRTAYFFDDKDYNLKDAYRALNSGDINRAFELSKQNLEECRKGGKVKDKMLSHAIYNLGLCHMLRGEYDQSIQLLNEAREYKSGNIITDAIAECQHAKSVSESMKQVEEKASIETSRIQATEEKKMKSIEANTLDNSGIIEMAKMKLPESIIIQKIKTSPCQFDTTPNALVSLNKAGVNEKIIMAMMDKK